MTRKPILAPWLKNTVQMTAVVLNWKRLDNLKRIVPQLKECHFISEVLIWNNNPSAITFEDVGLSQHYDWLTIINSKENLKDEAKYLAAASAKNDYIFYQDDDWSTKHYIDALYASYCMNPEHLHVATGELTWAENLFFTFYNKELNIQSEFCFIGCGAMFPKHLAETHLQKLRKHFNATERAYADVAFSLLLNQPIVKVQVGLSPFSSGYAFSSEADFNDVVASMKLKTIDLLIRYAQEKRVLPRRVARSAFRNLILFTSFLPAELDQSQQVFDIENSDHVASRIKIKPSNGLSSEFRKNPYFFAIAEIPGKPECYWHTSVDINDEWGVWLLKPMRIQLNIHELNAHANGNGLASLWHVNIDHSVEIISLEELMNFDRTIKTQLSLRSVDSAVRLAIQLKYSILI